MRVIHKGVKVKGMKLYYLECAAGHRGSFSWLLTWTGVTCKRCLRVKPADVPEGE